MVSGKAGLNGLAFFVGERMNQTGWKKRIKRRCVEAGTYRDFFEDIIDTLAQIMATRDEALEMWKKDFGGRPVVAREMSDGRKKIEKNPGLEMVNDLDGQALAYWRDLGLTPAGYKKLNADVVEDRGAGGFERLIEKIVK